MAVPFLNQVLFYFSATNAIPRIQSASAAHLSFALRGQDFDKMYGLDARFDLFQPSGDIH